MEPNTQQDKEVSRYTRYGFDDFLRAVDKDSPSEDSALRIMAGDASLLTGNMRGGLSVLAYQSAEEFIDIAAGGGSIYSGFIDTIFLPENIQVLGTYTKLAVAYPELGSGSAGTIVANIYYNPDFEASSGGVSIDVATGENITSIFTQPTIVTDGSSITSTSNLEHTYLSRRMKSGSNNYGYVFEVSSGDPLCYLAIRIIYTNIMLVKLG